MITDHYYQQILRWKAGNLDLFFGTYVGTNQTKIEKISISRAILLEFLRSLVSAIRCEANKINQRREERPIGSRAVKMLRDLRRRACGPARHVAAANVHTEVRAHIHNWSIWCQGSSRTIGCVMAHSKMWPARGEPTEQKPTCAGGNLDYSVDSARFLAFTRQRYIKWS